MMAVIFPLYIKETEVLIRSLRIVRNAGQMKEIARDSLLYAQRDFLIAALTQFFDGLYANKLSFFQNGHRSHSFCTSLSTWEEKNTVAPRLFSSFRIS